MFISLFIFIAVSLPCFISLFLFPRTSLALSLSSSYLLSSLFVHSTIFSFLHSLISTISLFILISPPSPSYSLPHPTILPIIFSLYSLSHHLSPFFTLLSLFLSSTLHSPSLPLTLHPPLPSHSPTFAPPPTKRLSRA